MFSLSFLSFHFQLRITSQGRTSIFIDRFNSHEDVRATRLKDWNEKVYANSLQQQLERNRVLSEIRVSQVFKRTLKVLASTPSDQALLLSLSLKLLHSLSALLSLNLPPIPPRHSFDLPSSRYSMDLISPSKQDEDSDSGSEGSEDEETKKKENKKIEEADWEEDDDEEDEDYEIYSKAIVPS